MEAKEKAEELYAKFLAITAEDSIDNPISLMKKPIEMALICVEEIIKSYPHGYSISDRLYWGTQDKYSFWEEVKEELNKMK